GYSAGNASAQMDNLVDFMRHLERQGLVVDAYFDLRDGKMVGEITSKTNFLVSGFRAVSLGTSDTDDRVKAINDGIKTMRDKAVDTGLFIISPDNFAIVTGYRRAGGEVSEEVRRFVPQPPLGGPPTAGVV